MNYLYGSDTLSRARECVSFGTDDFFKNESSVKGFELLVFLILSYPKYLYLFIGSNYNKVFTKQAITYVSK